MFDQTKPQRMSIRYSIPTRLLKESTTTFAQVEAQERLARQLLQYLVKDCMTTRLEDSEGYNSTVFELNGYFVTPQALELLVQDRLNKAHSGYPAVDFY